MPLIVLLYKKSHIPGYRSIEKELVWFFLLHTNFLGVLGLCVCISVGTPGRGSFRFYVLLGSLHSGDTRGI